MTETSTIPLLDNVQVNNNPMPLHWVHWRLFHTVAFDIRQHVSKPLNLGGLDFTLTQYENTQRGIETIRGIASYKELLKDGAGAEAWLKRLCTLINLKIQGSSPIEKLNLVRTTQDYLAYYGVFFSNNMEIILYLGSGEDINGATVIHFGRSKVDEKTRDWTRIAQQLPQEVLVEEGLGSQLPQQT